MREGRRASKSLRSAGVEVIVSGHRFGIGLLDLSRSIVSVLRSDTQCYSYIREEDKGRNFPKKVPIFLADIRNRRVY